MSTKGLLERFQQWRREGRPLVLATVVETAGSTYSRAGHRILIAAGGDYQGLVSGGCLEGDLAAHAQQVLATGRATCVTYDMRGEEDLLWGLGVGCDGLLRILLQPLVPGDNWEPFTRIAAVLTGEQEGTCAVVTEDCGRVRAGATLIASVGGIDAFGLDAEDAATLRRYCEGHTAPAGTTGVLRDVVLRAGPCRVVVSPLLPIPRLLVLGAALDAVPLARMAGELGWRVTVYDHRPGYLHRPEWSDIPDVHCGPAADMASRITLGQYAAVVVMSHHLATDRTYLLQLAETAIPYVGLLGPRARRERLLREIGPAAGPLAGRLHGPAGLDIGADSPESIALSILAEMQALRPRAADTPQDMAADSPAARSRALP